jgi:PAS domain S-box-containing protein
MPSAPLDYRRIFDSAPAPLLVLSPDPSFTILDANDAFLRATRTKRDAIVGRSLFDAFPAGAGATATTALRAALERVLGEHAAQPSNVPIFADDGSIACIVHRVEDVTSLVTRDERTQLLIDSITDYAVFMLDPDGRIVSWNPGAERIKQYRAHEIIGRHFSVFYPEAAVRAGKCEHELRVAAETGRFEDEGWRVRKDGSEFWANVIISAVRDDKARLVGFSKVTRDLTERKQNEEERAARVAAEQANRAKDEFLAMLGHELRNPLSPIVTALQLMKLRGDNRSAREQEIIERQVKHLTRLVDDLLDVSRVARGKVELAKKPVQLAEVVLKAVEMASPLLELRRHRLSVEVARDGLLVLGDETRLAQVVANLLTNAAKYTDAGGDITVAAAREGDHAVLRVRDNGIGIRPELLGRVFDLFVQGSQSSERSQGGLGLGLTLVRNLVELHGGTVTAHSEGVDRGSELVVRLPALAIQVVAPNDGGGARTLRATSGGRRVLVVDDNPDAVELLAELLETIGHTVAVAHDGPRALEVARSFHPEVAILDIGLPVMDGYELAQRLREELGPAATPHLIALTGYGQEHDVQRSKAIGFAEHMVKPVEPEALVRSLGALVARAAERQSRE